jgi:DNA-binding transcriptional LysR family regulator
VNRAQVVPGIEPPDRRAGNRPAAEGKDRRQRSERPPRRHRLGSARRSRACEVDALPHLLELVTLGIGVSLLPAAAIRMTGGRAIGVATEPSIPRELVLVTPLDREPSPAGAAFLRLLEDDPRSAA